MEQKYYTFKELQEKYGWNSGTNGLIERQINYAKNRGVEIEFAFKKGKSYFIIVNDLIGDEVWKTYPLNPKYEVTKTGLARNASTKKLVGHKDDKGYIGIWDNTQTPTKRYAIHRMIMETFNPIENSDMYVVDHINGKRDDNRLENLRWLTQRHNMEERDKNYAKLNINFQKLIEKYGYEKLNQIFEDLL